MRHVGVSGRHGSWSNDTLLPGFGDWGVCTEEESNLESDGGAVAVGGHVICNRR